MALDFWAAAKYQHTINIARARLSSGCLNSLDSYHIPSIQRLPEIAVHLLILQYRSLTKRFNKMTEEHPNKGVTPDARTKSPMSSPDSDPNEMFYTPNQSTQPSPEKKDRKELSPSGSDNFHPAETNNNVEVKESTPTPGPIDALTESLRQHIAPSIPRSEVGKISRAFHDNTTISHQVTSASSTFSPTSEFHSTKASLYHSSGSNTSNPKRILKPATKMQSRLEAIRRLAIEREAAHVATEPQMMPAIQVTGIAPFPTLSESEAGGNADTPEVASSTRPMTPITEEEKSAEEHGSGATTTTAGTSTTATTPTSSNLSALAAEFVPSGKRPPEQAQILSLTFSRNSPHLQQRRRRHPISLDPPIRPEPRLILRPSNRHDRGRWSTASQHRAPRRHLPCSEEPAHCPRDHQPRAHDS